MHTVYSGSSKYVNEIVNCIEYRIKEDCFPKSHVMKVYTSMMCVCVLWVIYLTSNRARRCISRERLLTCKWERTISRLFMQTPSIVRRLPISLHPEQNSYYFKAAGVWLLLVEPPRYMFDVGYETFKRMGRICCFLLCMFEWRFGRICISLRNH